MSQHGLCRGMNVQCGRDEIETRRQWRKFHTSEVAVALKLTESRVRISSFAMMMPHANPVVETLQSEVQIVLCFELEHREPSVCSNSKKVEHAAIARTRDSRNLRVNMFGIEMRKHARSVGAFDAVIVGQRLSVGTIAARVRIWIVGE